MSFQQSFQYKPLKMLPKRKLNSIKNRQFYAGYIRLNIYFQGVVQNLLLQ